MKQCKKCGAAVADNMKFCTMCGGSEFVFGPGGPAATAFCKKCGTANPNDSKFCISCGAPMQVFGEAGNNMPMGVPDMTNTQAPAPMPAPTPEQAPAENTVETDNAQSGRGKKEPVVGWIVSLSGADMGEDYHIRSKNNRIGIRGTDICLNANPAVTSNDYATIAYYTKNNTYYLIPGDSVDSIRVNGENIELPTILNGGDIILIGESEYKFVPLCDEAFKWDAQ